MNKNGSPYSAPITIEEDRLDFLLFAYFGTVTNPYLASSRRAYLDFCRTLRFHGESGQEYREHIDELLCERISSLIGNPVIFQEEYDIWHHTLCNDVVKFYREAGIDFNLGHAQKWVNMTMKYLYINGGVDVNEIFSFLHVPLDRYVFAAAENCLSIQRPCDAWSKIANYDDYLGYQQRIREKVDGAPLRWEFRHWIDEALRMNETDPK